jgi:hypothetical protein
MLVLLFDVEGPQRLISLPSVKEFDIDLLYLQVYSCHLLDP